MVTGFCCGNIHSASIAALHQIPLDEDGGIVALRVCSDAGEGARGWGKRQTSLNDSAACMNLCFPNGSAYFIDLLPVCKSMVAVG